MHLYFRNPTSEEVDCVRRSTAYDLEKQSGHAKYAIVFSIIFLIVIIVNFFMFLPPHTSALLTLFLPTLLLTASPFIILLICDVVALRHYKDYYTNISQACFQMAPVHFVDKYQKTYYRSWNNPTHYYVIVEDDFGNRRKLEINPMQYNSTLSAGKLYLIRPYEGRAILNSCDLYFAESEMSPEVKAYYALTQMEAMEKHKPF